MRSIALCAICAVVVGIAGTRPVLAETAPDFAGKTVTFHIASRTGGIYDFYTRLLAEHIRPHVRGNPTIVFKWHEASGGLVGSNYMHSAAPRDGTYVGTTQQTIPVSQVINPGVGRFDVREWNLLGTMTPTRNVLAIWKAGAPATTLDAMKSTEVLIGGTSKTSPTYIYPILTNRFLGTRFRMVMGYQFGAAHMAMEQGEHYRLVSTLFGFETRYSQYIKENKLIWLMQYGLSKDPGLPDVPLLQDLVQDATAKDVIEVVSMANEFGYFYYLPPGVPKAVVDMWRGAFMKAVRAPELLADAKKRGIPIEPKDHRHLENLVKRLHSASPEVIALAREAMAGKR